MRPTALQLASALILGAALAAAGGGAQTNTALPQPPPGNPSVTPGVTVNHLSPVEKFRVLLGMTPAERQRVLAGKPAADRTLVLAKLKEYQDMPREAREQRLTQTELHWHLLALMRLDPAQRPARMKEISPLFFPMIQQQLAQWDEVPAATRQELLKKEGFLRAFLEWQDYSPAGPEAFLARLPAQERARWREELQWWQALPESRRAELRRQFRQFFYLTGEEQKQTIQALSDSERRQMELALRAYAGLPPAQRRQCVDSFGKFASMAPEERSQFLQNAAKWEAMTPHERQLWRRLVNELPPMPPGFLPPPMPPMPPGFHWPPVPPPPAANPPPAAMKPAQSTNPGA
jgi:hypothetical protein